MMTNAQAQAYAMVAMSRLGFDHDAIQAVEREMYYLFDVLTEEEAEEKAYGVKGAKLVCECCGSKDDVTEILVALDRNRKLCLTCRAAWFRGMGR